MNGETHLSQHLKFKEVRCKCRVCDGGFLMPETIKLFEDIREASGGRPLTVTSGFRCAPYNKLVGGVPDSYHQTGQAVDILFPDHIAPREFYLLCSKLANGCGLYSWGVHVDTGRRRHQWIDRSWKNAEAAGTGGRNQQTGVQTDNQTQKKTAQKNLGVAQKKL